MTSTPSCSLLNENFFTEAPVKVIHTRAKRQLLFEEEMSDSDRDALPADASERKSFDTDLTIIWVNGNVYPISEIMAGGLR